MSVQKYSVVMSFVTWAKGNQEAETPIGRTVTYRAVLGEPSPDIVVLCSDEPKVALSWDKSDGSEIQDGGNIEEAGIRFWANSLSAAYAPRNSRCRVKAEFAAIGRDLILQVLPQPAI